MDTYETPSSELEVPINRRVFLMTAAGALGTVVGKPAFAQILALAKSCGSDPIRLMKERNWPILVAFAEAELAALWHGRPEDRPEAVATDFIRYVAHLEPPYQQGLCAALTWLNSYSISQTGRRWHELGPRDRQHLLDQGEGPGRWRRIAWEQDYLLHTAISSLAMIFRLVICSREPARHYVGMTWSAACARAERLAKVPAPAYPDLSREYDLCIIGSGAGGAVVAARAAERGLRVLIVEEGAWVSPDSLAVRKADSRGGITVGPPRGDEVLARLYRGAGVQMAGELGRQLQNPGDLLSPERRRKIRPVQTINFIQARVVGGGPYINNAIHLPISERAWNRWRGFHPTGVRYADLSRRMEGIQRDLGVNTEATRRGAGIRSLRFAQGCRKAGIPVEPLPVSILPEPVACGSDNSVDPFGAHTGGIHPHRPQGPNSYLMRALKANTPAGLAHQLRAVRFGLSEAEGTPSARHLLVEDRRGLGPNEPGLYREIRARRFVLAAGVGASTSVLQNTARSAGKRIPGLGERLTANVIAPVYAVYDRPVYRGDTALPEPGIAQCFYVRDVTDSEARGGRTREPALENWFHYPGTLAVALTGWFDEWARLMRKYNHMAVCGMVVPTKVRPQNRIGEDGKPRLEVDGEEFDLLLRGIEKIGRIFLAGATAGDGVSLYLPTKAVLQGQGGRPAGIRNHPQLRWALGEIRKRGPAFLNLATSHPQGGNSLGTVVNPSTFRVRLENGADVANLYVADASLFPAGCEVNPQLTVKALATYVADKVLSNQ